VRIDNDANGKTPYKLETLMHSSQYSHCHWKAGHSDYFIPMLARAAAQDKPFDSKPVLQRLERVTLEIDEIDISFEAVDYRSSVSQRYSYSAPTDSAKSRIGNPFTQSRAGDI
jgi:hypothetical protein